MLTDDPQKECTDSISNTGLWMAEQQLDVKFDLKMYNDLPFENGKQVGLSKHVDGMYLRNLTPNKTVTYKTIDGVELKLHCFEPKGHKASDQLQLLCFSLVAVGMAELQSNSINRRDNLPIAVWSPCQPSTA